MKQESHDFSRGYVNYLTHDVKYIMYKFSGDVQKSENKSENKSQKTQTSTKNKSKTATKKATEAKKEQDKKPEVKTASERPNISSEEYQTSGYYQDMRGMSPNKKELEEFNSKVKAIPSKIVETGQKASEAMEEAGLEDYDY